MDIVWITSAKYQDAYRLLLTFNNGEVKIFDAQELVSKNSLYKSLQPLANFQNFMLDGWTVSWQDGQIDIAPEFLYENSQAICA